MLDQPEVPQLPRQLVSHSSGLSLVGISPRRNASLLEQNAPSRACPCYCQPCFPETNEKAEHRRVYRICARRRDLRESARSAIPRKSDVRAPGRSPRRRRRRTLHIPCCVLRPSTTSSHQTYSPWTKSVCYRSCSHHTKGKVIVKQEPRPGGLAEVGDHAFSRSPTASAAAARTTVAASRSSGHSGTGSETGTRHRSAGAG